jgi:3-methyladenine DNA glycosylase AlkD
MPLPAYYAKMSVAWLLATAFAKYPEQIREFVRKQTLPEDVIKLYVRKARESFRTRKMVAY